MSHWQYDQLRILFSSTVQRLGEGKIGHGIERRKYGLQIAKDAGNFERCIVMNMMMKADKSFHVHHCDLEMTSDEFDYTDSERNEKRLVKAFGFAKVHIQTGTVFIRILSS